LDSVLEKRATDFFRQKGVSVRAEGATGHPVMEHPPLPTSSLPPLFTSQFPQNQFPINGIDVVNDLSEVASFLPSLETKKDMKLTS
jgi:hypothetical protein